MPEWDKVAPYYDDLFGDRTIDIAFWTRLTRTLGSPILELGCGTGRLTFPIARTGATITGLDISRPMLAVANQKRKQYSTDMKNRIKFLRADAMAFTLASRFRAVYSPWGFVPVTKKEQSSLLSSVARHVEPDGYFVVDIENLKKPTAHWHFTRLVSEKKLPNGTTLIRRALHQGHKTTQIGKITYTLDIVKRDKVIKRIVTTRRIRVYTPDDLKKLLASRGFSIVKVYGNYDFSPWTKTSPQAIVVAQYTRSPLKRLENVLGLRLSSGKKSPKSRFPHYAH